MNNILEGVANPYRVDVINNGTLIQGDCLEVMDILISEGIKVDAVITDPPYGTTACKWDTVIPFEPMWDRLNKLIKLNGAIVLFGSEPFSSALRMSNIKNYKYDWIYRKPQGVNPLMSKKQPLNDIENISVFYKKQCLYNPQLVKGEPYKISRDKNDRIIAVQNLKTKPTTTVNEGTRLPKRVLEFKQDRGLHPTQKPVALIEYLIKTYTNEGELVLDFTSGSGTLAVACENTNRRWICIEKEEKYYEISKQRLLEKP